MVIKKDGRHVRGADVIPSVEWSIKTWQERSADRDRGQIGHVTGFLLLAVQGWGGG